MPFGNPNCKAIAQNCSAAACCTYNGLCPEDWTVPDTCYYPYYWYNDRITTEIAIGIGVTVFAFVVITIAIGILQWFYRHRKSYHLLKEKRSEVGDASIAQNQIDDIKQVSEGKEQSEKALSKKQDEKGSVREEEKEEQEQQIADIVSKEKKKETSKTPNEDENQFLQDEVIYLEYD